VALSPIERQRAKTEAQAIMDAASRDLERGALDDASWASAVADALAAAYLRDDDPRWQSGFDGDSQLWREARDLILLPVHRDGTFLDIGCATGHLMECLQSWALEQGRRLSMFGLEVSTALAANARLRLPALANRVFDGNVLDWSPPHPFTFVHTGLEYVPAARRSWLVRRLLDDFLEPDGRLISGPVNEAELAVTMAAFERAGATPESSQRTDRNGKVRYVVWCGI
jgi:trans-aconitate methyltransferase